MIITCPRCFSADDVERPRRLPDHVLQYRCVNPEHGIHEWLTTLDVVQPAGEVRAGVTDDLLGPLNDCVEADDPLLEYGIVEHRLRTRFPDLFAAHVGDQGHNLLGTRLYTASGVRFGVALYRLQRRGELVSEYGRATGAWSYNGQVTYWARTGQQSRVHKTWVEYCEEIGRSPEWTPEDLRGLPA